MADSTTNISLTKPEATDTTLIREDFNDNMDIIDGRFSATYMAVQAAASVAITGGSITGITDITVADGGTGSSTLTDGGVLLGSGTGAITAMAVLTDGQMIVGNGTTDPVAESGATLRTSIGAASRALDNIASCAINAALLLGTSDAAALGSATKMWSDLFLASGGVIYFNNTDVTLTHSSNTLTLGGTTTLALGATNITMTGSLADTTNRVTKGWFTNLESTNDITISGTALAAIYQPLDGTLTALAGLTISANSLVYGTGADAFSVLATNSTGTNKFLREVSSGAPSWETLVAGDIPDISATYQPLDTALTNISALVYVSPSFIKLTADDTYAVRTLSETLTDIGGAALQGVSAIGAVTFVDATHILSVATITYWFDGATYTTANPTTCDIDSYETLTDNTLYFFYFDDATGTLKCSDTTWNFTTQVMVATVFWNGTNGAIQKEWHNSTRNLAWHEWAHDTVGTRYGAGLSLTAPTTDADATLTIASGSVQDEDLLITIGEQSTCRIVYKASASIYTWVDSSLPYAGASADPKWLDTDNYTLTSVGDSDFVCMWVYATSDTGRPIYIIPTHAATAHNIIAGARAETAPVLSDLNLNPEMKLIYRFIYKGDGQFQESNDYRLTSPLPSGGSASTNASAVSFSPSGNIAATTVQTAIEELDTEKAAVAQTMYIGTTQVAINRASAALTLAGLTLTTPNLGTPSTLVGTNISGTASSLTAGAVTNATFTTALTVDTGTLTLTANVGNSSILTIGAGAVSVSGSNTGDQTNISGNAATVTVDATTTDTSCFVAIFESASGSLEPQTDATLTYQAVTGILTATGFAGALTGNVTGTADVATGFTCTDNESEALACPVIFVDGATGTQGAETDDTDFTYNPSTGNLSATQFEGIIAANLLDKSASESITADWDTTGTFDIANNNAAAGGDAGFQSHIIQITTALTGTLHGAYITASNNQAAECSGTIRGLEVKGRAKSVGGTGATIAVLEGVSISADSKDQSVTTMRGMEVMLDGSTGGTVTEGVGVRIANNMQADKTTTMTALQIYSDSFAYDYGIDMSANGGAGGITTDIKFSDDNTITDSASGLIISGASVIYGGNSTYLRIGDAGTTAYSLADDDDLMVTGKLEVTGSAYFPGFAEFFNQVYYSSHANFIGTWARFRFGPNSEVSMAFDANQTNDCFTLAVDDTSKNFIIIDYEEFANYATAVSSTPTLWVYSSTSATSATDEWINLTHDITDGVISTGSGNLILSPASGNVTAPSGSYIHTVITMDDGDTTPDVSGGEIFVSQSNTGATAITDIDNPTVGQIVTIVCGDATNAPTIADGGNFKMSAAWNSTLDDSITFFVKSDNYYIELSRSVN